MYEWQTVVRLRYAANSKAQMMQIKLTRYNLRFLKLTDVEIHVLTNNEWVAFSSRSMWYLF